MWHEARKQERKIRVMMVDYQKRADRRRQYYEQIKLDPTQFMRVYGRPAKIHLDPAVALAAEGPQIMQPWQGNTDVMIDRYDARTHMDYIPEVPSSTQLSASSDEEESRCCYERYRILVQNECAGVTEEQCLNQIFVDEQFGAVDNPLAKKAEEDKKKLADKKAAIGYTYEDSTPAEANDEDEESSDEEIDLDNILDIDALTDEQEQVLNTISLEYGMKGMDYADCLQIDRDEVEALRQAKQLEEEKAQYSGRKSRRERRAFKEKRMKNRLPSPPSYAAKEAPKKTALIKALSSSRSRSKSPVVPGVVEFITSFGGDSDNEGAVHGPSLPPQQIRKKLTSSSRAYRSRSRDRSSDRQRSSSDIRSQNRTDSKSGHSSSSSRRDSRSSLSARRQSRSRSRDSRSRRRSDRSRSREYGRNEWGRDRYRDRDRSGQRDHNSSSFSSHRLSYSRRTSNDRGYDDRYSRFAHNSSSGGKYSSYRSNRRSSRSISRSRSRSNSKQRQRATSRSRSSSSSRAAADRAPSPPPIKSYRRPSLSSKSSSDFSSDDESATKSSSTGAAGGGDDRSQDSTGNRSEMNKSLIGKVEGKATKCGLTPQERLKKKMQIVLNRQLKADKRAQKEKEDKEEQIRQDREEELRVISMQMRQRERERRHREREREDTELEKRDRSSRFEDDDDRPARYRRHSSSRSRSPTRTSSRSHRERRHRSRSGSPQIPRLVDY